MKPVDNAHEDQYGDYQGLAADFAGVFRLSWTDSHVIPTVAPQEEAFSAYVIP